VIAGPCSVEPREQLLRVARRVRDAGATALLGGVFRMRSDPRSFRGLGAGLHPILRATGRDL